jgi:hypothetical protein
MNTSLPVLAVVLLLLVYTARAEPRPAEVVVAVSADRVEIRAHRAPLHRIVDAIAASQGFAVHYDGRPPSQLVTVRLFAGRVDDALRSLLGRSRVKYALSVDPASRRIRRLVIVDPDGTRADPPRPTPEPTPVPGWRPDPVATIDEPPLPDHPVPPDE